MSILSLYKDSMAAELAAKTPRTRDRYVDFLRAFSICAVVFGHWISTVVVLGDNGFMVYNAAGIIPGVWLATWVFQVMPLFFFVGGFSNFVSINSYRRRKKSDIAFIRVRAIRLLKPTVVFLAVWFVIIALIVFVLRDGTHLVRNFRMVFAPLWFLVVFCMMIVLTPIMEGLHRCCRIWILVALFALMIVVDIFRFWSPIPSVSWANVAFVWLFVHQLGFFYADGSLVRAPKWVHVAMTLGGLLSLIILTNIGIYHKSMVGTGFEKTSNMNPPTVPIAILACWLIGVAMLLRNTLIRWLVRLKPWMIVVQANSVIMTMYLWHLTAFAIVFLVLFSLGLAREPAGTLVWWVQRPVWIIGPAIILAGFIKIFARFESLARAKSPLSREEP
jgi:peptidoglycan/LPS O-acetylase OafA/YrhL